MKLYVELSPHNCRVTFREVWFYLLEVRQWVELDNIHKDAGGYT